MSITPLITYRDRRRESGTSPEAGAADDDDIQKGLSSRPDLIVDLLHSYSNPNSQVDEAIESMVAPSEPLTAASGPSWQPRPDCDPSVANNLPLPQPHALSRRLTADQRREIAAAFNNGTPQKELAATHGISIRSVKRLVHAAREKTQ